MQSLKHIHEYMRVVNHDGSPDKNRFRCVHPDCSHWSFRNLLMGKRSICSICHTQEIILDTESLRRAKPRCFKCGNSEKDRNLRQKYDELAKLFEEPTAAAPEGGAA